MARIYSVNVNHNYKVGGVEFVNGVAVVEDTETEMLNYFENKGYEVITGDDSNLTELEKLNLEQLKEIAEELKIVKNYTSKKEALTDIKGQSNAFTIEITEFDVEDIDGGDTENPIFKDATEVIEALPQFVTANGAGTLIEVDSWADTDNYNASVAGTYTFTGTISELPEPYANTASTPLTIDVIVAEPESEDGEE